MWGITPERVDALCRDAALITEHTASLQRIADHTERIAVALEAFVEQNASVARAITDPMQERIPGL